MPDGGIDVAVRGNKNGPPDVGPAGHLDRMRLYADTTETTKPPGLSAPAA